MRAILPSGEATTVAGRTRLKDPELRRARDLAMIRMRHQGLSVDEVARYHRVSVWTVYKRLAQVPESARRRAVAV